MEGRKEVGTGLQSKSQILGTQAESQILTVQSPRESVPRCREQVARGGGGSDEEGCAEAVAFSYFWGNHSAEVSQAKLRGMVR